MGVWAKILPYQSSARWETLRILIGGARRSTYTAERLAKARPAEYRSVAGCLI